jgi:hypothetical protein
MDGHPIAAAYRAAVFAPVLLDGQQRLVDSMRERLAGEASSLQTVGRPRQRVSAGLR